MNEVKIGGGWHEVLAPEFDKKYFKELSNFVRKEFISQKVFPAPKNIFRAFDLCPFKETKVVI